MKFTDVGFWLPHLWPLLPNLFGAETPGETLALLIKVGQIGSRTLTCFGKMKGQ